MVNNSSSRRERLLSRLGEPARELMAAWLLVFFVVAAGGSILAINRYRVVDCPTVVTLPGQHYRLVAHHKWDDPACSTGACDHSWAAHDVDPDSMRAAQSDSGDAAPVYSGSGTPSSLRGDSGRQDERLC